MSYDTVGRLSGKQLSVNGSVHYTDSMGYDVRDRGRKKVSGTVC
jgi:hypothetical protein